MKSREIFHPLPPTNLPMGTAPHPIDIMGQKSKRGDMTKKEFIIDYCKRKNVSILLVLSYNVALPCFCGSKECQGWQMVPSNPVSILKHELLYSEIGEMI
jgi:hypothetical protein